MKKLFYLLLILTFILNSCSNRYSKEFKHQFAQDLELYKYHVFKTCLRKAYYANKYINSIVFNDGSNLADGLSDFKLYDYADSIANKINEKIILDSMTRRNHIYDPEYFKKAIFEHCLDYYTSIEFNKLAQKQVKKLTLEDYKRSKD